MYGNSIKDFVYISVLFNDFEKAEKGSSVLEQIPANVISITSKMNKRPVTSAGGVQSSKWQVIGSSAISLHWWRITFLSLILLVWPSYLKLISAVSHVNLLVLIITVPPVNLLTKCTLAAIHFYTTWGFVYTRAKQQHLVVILGTLYSNTAQELSKPLCNIINYSFQTSKYPSLWKKGNVIPAS